MLQNWLAEGAHTRFLAPGLYSVLDERESGAPYDSRARAYDRMVRSQFYLRTAWGLRRETIAQFIGRAFQSKTEGLILDLAAGSSVDAFAAYARTPRPTLIVDRSLAMLRRGVARLEHECGRVPDHVCFLQADALALPLRNGCVSTLLCHGAYHLLPSLDVVQAQWRQVLADDGSAFVSCLVTGRSFGDRYLRLLHRAGEINPPMSPEQFLCNLNEGFAADWKLEVRGNFAFAAMNRKGENHVV